MRILYLIMLYNGDINGGHTYKMATVQIIRDIVGYENLDIVLSELDTSEWNANVVLRLKSYQGNLSKFRNLLQGNITQISNKDIKMIVELINKNKYDMVIFGNSETGRLIKTIKNKCNVKTLTLYNDIVTDVINKKKKNNFDIKYLPIWNNEIKAEKIDSQLTDYIITLHERDGSLLKKYLHREADAYLPIILEDKYKESNQLYKNRNELSLLFVGAYTWNVNVIAVKWFCEEVLSQLEEYNIVFNVAGYKMEQLKKEEWTKKYRKLNIIGTVDDLSQVYNEADVVVLPIISGAGMKVKTAEALMYGKRVLGTKEALVGYDEISNCECNSGEEFKNRIVELYQQEFGKFFIDNRKYFENNFSVKGTKEKMKNILNEISNK
ncbi:glycosyltransferase [uncultured Brachyspira sp.]|uniref:glycosyltransferase n=1 Tax=uncultured Brachyspira sp. TaxID=221953 RepID=UPI00322028A8